EYLGIKFTNDLSKLKRTLDQAGICILHAPLFHPAMKHVAPIRKALGVKTFFNMLGPLVNPARPKNQMVGVFNLELARLYGYLFQESAKNYAILHDLAGYDEISLTNTTKVITNHQDAMITAQSLKVNSVTEAAIFGGVSIQEAAHIFVSILEGRGTEAQNNVVCANAGLAISIVNNLTHLEGFELAKISLKEKKALKSFKKLQTLSC
ncbi:MAG: anthranilate phosphoribosyltransferase, partial [Flavobacteriales bacterium CG_4_8_14_3_um_filter_35_10]